MNAPLRWPGRLVCTLPVLASLYLAVPGLPLLRADATPPRPAVLDPEAFASYVAAFNRNDNELYPQHVSNAAAWDWMKANVPLFECPDQELEETYYFRWWTFRKHLKQTPDGFVITEFLPPVPWAGKYNTISCAAGHHFREGRWINDPTYLDDYARFWFRHGGDPRRYSFWAADAIWARRLVTGEDALAKDLLPDLIRNYDAWERERRDANGLYWQVDGQDGMEVSISGALQPQAEGYRVTLNSYQYGDALAIARIADAAGRPETAEIFRAHAAELKQLVQTKLWDAEAAFYKVMPRAERARLSDARELHGYTPWYFGLPDTAQAVAWRQLFDPQGFAAPFGPTTAEQRHPKFAVSYQGHECQWNGPSWPYATAVTLTALANLLQGEPQRVVSRDEYFALLKTYARSHRLTLENGQRVPWIDENLNPFTGDWLARTRLKTWNQGTWDPGKGGVERGKDYNHSTFGDLVINGLVGLRPRADDTVEVNPLLPEGTWDYFCLDQVRYHRRWLTILYDRTGDRYGKGRGLRVLADGREIGAMEKLGRLVATLPATSDRVADGPESGRARLQPSRRVSENDPPRPEPRPTSVGATPGGWVKYAGNPVLGGEYGTCFDVSVLKEADSYRMWVSWRPKQSVALVESPDGIHWSGPPRIVLGPRPASGWEDDINRPVVLKREDGYHLWYTGQAKDHSWIGYATSPDGATWTRRSDRPVLSPDQPWEKVALMCPHVLWDEDSRVFRMWYSGGDQYEPDAIGYATSPDGLTWTKHAANPVFRADPTREWEQHKVTACQVIRQGDWQVMFYIGFRDEDHAQIGMARSRDGLTGWQRHPANPIIRPGANEWDHDACYKPYAVFDGRRWLLWYNGRHGNLEQIGVVFHDGEALGFESSPP